MLSHLGLDLFRGEGAIWDHPGDGIEALSIIVKIYITRDPLAEMAFVMSSGSEFDPMPSGNERGKVVFPSWARLNDDKELSQIIGH